MPFEKISNKRNWDTQNGEREGTDGRITGVGGYMLFVVPSPNYYHWGVFPLNSLRDLEVMREGILEDERLLFRRYLPPPIKAQAQQLELDSYFNLVDMEMVFVPADCELFFFSSSFFLRGVGWEDISGNARPKCRRCARCLRTRPSLNGQREESIYMNNDTGTLCPKLSYVARGEREGERERERRVTISRSSTTGQSKRA